LSVQLLEKVSRRVLSRAGATDIIALDGGKEKIKTLIYMSKEWDKIMYDAE